MALTPEEQIAADKHRIANKNRLIAEAAQNLAIEKFKTKKIREQLLLPAEDIPDVDIEGYVGELQEAIENPSDEELYIPPLPPGVTPPEVAAIIVTITREPGWNDVLGWKMIFDISDPEYIPANISISAHPESECTGYLYTPGALQYDSEIEKYWTICPAGQEQGDVDYHFGLLYAAAQLSCWTFEAGDEELEILIYGEE